MDFCSLQHMKDRRSTWRGVAPRYVPPSGFVCPLDGLLPSVPCRFFFTPAALMGFTLRSFLLPKGIRGVTTRMRPLTVLPVGAPAAVAMGRPSRPRFLGFDPSGRPWRSEEGLAHRPLDAPLGFCPSRVRCQKPCSSLRPNSSHALFRLRRLPRNHRRPRVSLGF
jgi:hypothetical protein